MNERIQELGKQAGLKIEYQMINPPKPLQILGSTEQFEKFAELIVRECAQIAVFKDSGTVATADVAGHMAAGRSIAARLIREHFGVEE
jgi:hypothetical protein